MARVRRIGKVYELSHNKIYDFCKILEENGYVLISEPSQIEDAEIRYGGRKIIKPDPDDRDLDVSVGSTVPKGIHAIAISTWNGKLNKLISRSERLGNNLETLTP